MNQTTISPKENVTLLLVAVPKGSKEHDFTEEQYLFYRLEGIGYIRLVEYPLSKIIGLASSITEEQAKELVEEMNEWKWLIRFKGPETAHVRAVDALRSFIDFSGLTIGKDQDCLILKID